MPQVSRGHILGISKIGGQLLTTVMCANVPPSAWHYRSLVPLSTLQEQVIYGAAIIPWMSPPNTRHSRQSAAAGWTQVIVSPHSSAPVSSWPSDPGTIQHSSDHRHQSWVGCPPGNSATTNNTNTSNSNNTLASNLATLETLKSDAPHNNKMKQVINVN